MKVSSQLLSIALLSALVSANERGRQNDWHKVTKPEKFKPDAPRNEGKVLRVDTPESDESTPSEESTTNTSRTKKEKPTPVSDIASITTAVEEAEATASLDLANEYPEKDSEQNSSTNVSVGSLISALMAVLFF